MEYDQQCIKVKKHFDESKKITLNIEHKKNSSKIPILKIKNSFPSVQQWRIKF